MAVVLDGSINIQGRGGVALWQGTSSLGRGRY